MLPKEFEAVFAHPFDSDDARRRAAGATLVKDVFMMITISECVAILCEEPNLEVGCEIEQKKCQQHNHHKTRQKQHSRSFFRCEKHRNGHFPVCFRNCYTVSGRSYGIIMSDTVQ